MKHFASPDFWKAYSLLPSSIKRKADKNYELLKNDPYHPSLHFKKINNYWSVRIGLGYRALGVDIDDGVLWFWIGSHADYDQLIKSL